MKKIFLCLIIVIGIFTLVGCGKKTDTKEVNDEKGIDQHVVGTFKYSDSAMEATYLFKDDGTGYYTITVGDNTVEKEVDYYTQGGKLYINYDKDPDTFELKYKVVDKGLEIYDSFGEKLLYKKIG